MPVVMARTRFMAQAERFEVDPLSGLIRCGGKTLGMDELQWDTPTHGTVYGVLMNYRGAVEALNTIGGESSAPPRAPLLFVKPANTWIAYGDAIPVPEDVDCVEAGAALGIVLPGAPRSVGPSYVKTGVSALMFDHSAAGARNPGC